MKKILSLIIFVLLTSCISVSVQTPTSAPSQAFITSTLPPTDNATAQPTRTLTVVPTIATRSTAQQAGCKDAAIVVKDVTIPDDTQLARGEIFTKTWQLQNVGKCAWIGYSIHFVSGEKMSALDSVEVPKTEAGSTVDISIEMTAPSNDGAYGSFFSLQNSAGDVVLVGTQSTFWVKIIVSNASALVPPAISSSTPYVPKGGNSNCKSSQNETYVNQLIQMINAARADAKISAVSMNASLKSAAQKHSEDMACNNFHAHTGSDGSWISDRIIAAGYSPSYYVEIIAIGSPQNAMDQWAADAPHWESVIDAQITEVGIGYAYYANSDFGGYITVDMGN